MVIRMRNGVEEQNIRIENKRLNKIIWPGPKCENCGEEEEANQQEWDMEMEMETKMKV